MNRTTLTAYIVGTVIVILIGYGIIGQANKIAQVMEDKISDQTSMLENNTK